jgi:hypothetical protein
MFSKSCLIHRWLMLESTMTTVRRRKKQTISAMSVSIGSPEVSCLVDSGARVWRLSEGSQVFRGTHQDNFSFQRPIRLIRRRSHPWRNRLILVTP